ncbi:MAG: DUF1036 domain-containing protein [Alphaproteobacteria bacterium]|nr:DUF1036 domain-containing protein [Alphaproteobacteria bacterium]
MFRTVFVRLSRFPACGATARRLVAVILALAVCIPERAEAALSFCNRTAGPIEAAVGYRADDTDQSTATDNWVSEGWWRIEPGQCARVYGDALTQRFYFYYAHALTQTSKNTPPTVWSGKYMFCTDDKAFRINGDSDCPSHNYQSTGFHELDIGANTRDYTLDFKDTANR